jgi:hypothetical protein
MLVTAVLALFAATSLGNAGLTTMPPAYVNGQAIESTTCHTIVGNKPTVNGTLNTIAYFEKEGGNDYTRIMRELDLDLTKQAPAYVFEGASAASYGSFKDNVTRYKALHTDTLMLYTADKDWKPSAQPTGRLTSWITNDGEAAATFPFLKTDKLHIQKCDFN